MVDLQCSINEAVCAGDDGRLKALLARLEAEVSECGFSWRIPPDPVVRPRPARLVCWLCSDGW